MDLNVKLNEYFAGKVVRKDFTKLIREGANVPVFVLEYLLGMYCSSMDETSITEGLDKVKKILKDNYVRPDEAEKVKSIIREKGLYKIIDKAEVKLNIKKDKLEHVKHDINKYLVEIHKKSALAFACFVFVLIGAPVGMMTKTSGVGMAFSVSSVVFLIYYGALTFGEELADRGIVDPFWAMWVSNFLFGIIGIYLIVISVKEMRVIDIQAVLNKIMIKLRIKK